MSDLELTDRYDDVLLAVPWRVKYDSTRDQTYLFKYAPHPERTGYIVIMTDLISLHYEILFGPLLPARLRSSRQLIHNQAEDEDEDEDPFEAVDKGLNKLAGLFSNAILWEEVELQVKEDRTYDLVVHLTTDTYAWIFNLTEARGRRPLSLIARHLVSPLTTLIAQKEGFSSSSSKTESKSKSTVKVEVQVEDPLKQTMDLLASTELQQSLDKITQGGDINVDGQNQSSSTLAAASRSTLGAGTEHTISKSAHKGPGLKRRVIRDSDSPTPSVSESTSISIDQRVKREPASSDKSPSPDKDKNTPKPKPTSKKAEFEPDNVHVEVEERIPTQMLSQKSKREREQEEEEAVERRMAEMRKKMASGGGGKLGRRRMGR